MKERFTGYGKEPKEFDTIPTRGWSDPSRREAFEKHLDTSLGEHGYEFNSSQYAQIGAVDLIADAVAANLNVEYGEDEPNFRSIRHVQFDDPGDSPGSTFSGGIILFGASNRELAANTQPIFARRVNQALEALEANVRLSEHTE